LFPHLENRACSSLAAYNDQPGPPVERETAAVKGSKDFLVADPHGNSIGLTPFLKPA